MPPKNVGGYFFLKIFCGVLNVHIPPFWKVVVCFLFLFFFKLGCASNCLNMLSYTILFTLIEIVKNKLTGVDKVFSSSGANF